MVPGWYERGKGWIRMNQITSPIVGWCLGWTFTSPWWMHRFTTLLVTRRGTPCFAQSVPTLSASPGKLGRVQWNLEMAHSVTPFFSFVDCMYIRNNVWLKHDLYYNLLHQRHNMCVYMYNSFIYIYIYTLLYYIHTHTHQINDYTACTQRINEHVNFTWTDFIPPKRARNVPSKSRAHTS